MRSLITIIIIVILLIGGSLTSYKYVQTSTRALEVPLMAIEQSISAQKWELAQKEMNTALLRWDKNKTWWTIIFDHQEIDTIDIGMKRLEKYIEIQDVSLSLGELTGLEVLVEHISNSVKLNLSNIL